MAEKTILVCDTCGRPAKESVTIKLARGNFVKDLCATHVNELIGGARRPRRGRPRAIVASSTGPKRTAAKRSGAKRTGARKRAAAKTGAKRTGARNRAATKTGAKRAVSKAS
jgi:hypothetical protein